MTDPINIEEATSAQLDGTAPVDVKLSFSLTALTFKIGNSGEPEVALTGVLVLFKKYMLASGEGGYEPIGQVEPISTEFAVTLSQHDLDILMPHTALSALTQADATHLVTTLLTQHCGRIPKAPEEYAGPKPPEPEIEEIVPELPNLYRVEDQNPTHEMWDGNVLEDINSFEDL